MTDEPTTSPEGGPTACPFVAFEDDRDHRSSVPDYNHRCFAAPEPEPRAFPHQERYCLSPEFARCPVFLDWARQEAATVKPAAAAPTSTFGDAVVGGAAVGLAEDEAAAPAFLAARSRVTAPADLLPAPKRAADASAGLWSYEGETKRSPAPSAPVPPSSLSPLSEPAVAMARRGPSHPGWENPPRLESFPRLRSREDRRANQPLFFTAVGVALVMVALIIFPIITSPHSSPVSSALSSGSGLVDNSTPSAEITPSTSMSFLVYLVKPGDYMAKIAAKFNISLTELELANPDVNPDYIQVGQPLNIPAPGQLTMPPATPTPSAT